MAPRSLDQIVASGARVSKREFFAALAAAGMDVIPTAKPTHFKVRVPGGVVIIATRRDDILPVYVSRVARAVGIRSGADDE